MAKIDKRRKYGIMLDTETANTIEMDGKLDMTNALFYDFGFAVIDSHGRVYETFSFVNRDIFVYERELMKSAYYADKIPQYIADLREGKRKMADTYEIRKAMLSAIKKYDCRFVCAHNARFDVTACNNTQRYTSKSKYRYFFPRYLEVWDTLMMARSVIAKMPTYRRFCEEHGYITKQNQVRLTAEVLHRFIHNDLTFVESHTGLEDVLIEAEILAYCQKQHKPMKKVLYGVR